MKDKEVIKQFMDLMRDHPILKEVKNIKRENYQIINKR